MQPQKFVKGLCEKYGGEIVAMRQNKHPTFRIRHRDKFFTFVVGATPSDWRASRNSDRTFRRLILAMN